MNTPYLKGGALALLSASSLYYLNQRLQLFKDISKILRVGKASKKWTQNLESEWSIVDTIEEQVQKNGNKIALILADNKHETRLTFNEVNKLANIVAHWAINNPSIDTNANSDRCVALFAENHPMFIVCLIGLAKAGVKVALLNNGIKLDALVHCIDQVKCDHIIYSTELTQSVSDIRQQLQKRNIGLSYLDNFKEKRVQNSAHQNLDTFIRSSMNNESVLSNEQLKQYRKGITGTSVLCYIYTSGTTGLPKAAIIAQVVPLILGVVFAMSFDLKSDDIIYGSGMPLYHTAAGLIGVGMHWVNGLTFIVKRKFSVTDFWDDIRTHNATVAQYIGEMVRYLCNAPRKPNDGNNPIRLAMGNGLRKDIWVAFQQRFNIPEIGELYGSTEGTVAMTNFHQNGLSGNTRGIGACGDMGYLLRKLMGFKIVKHDPINSRPVRDKKTGFFIEAEYGEPGELLGTIPDVNEYKGYTNKKATKKKILQNCFKKGDYFFRTGDLVKLESDGTIYFVDRIGDTFRWKGENCSTNEVEEVLLKFDGIAQANVYGIELKGHDGRAPMASIKLSDGFDFETENRKFYKHLKSSLPSYAVPLFIRISAMIETTGTYKLKKADLRSEGANPAKMGKMDKLYWLNGGRYEPLTPNKYSALPRAKL